MMELKRPLFSILIPTSGRAELIRMAVKSALKQTVTDFEIVIADLSGSPEARAAAEEPGDSRIRYFKTPEGGLSTWDFAAKQARGEHLLWLDDDNYLLPFALELFQKEIQRTQADIITASHFYYYDQAHPRHHLRNGLGVIPFTGESRPIDLRKALESLFDFSRRGAGSPIPRFHFSATVISRRVVEAAISRLGFVLITDMPNIHSLQAILFAFAKSCVLVDYPVVIVGRLGVSMSQIWSTAARERFRKMPFRPRLSPLTGYTRINGILENYLRVRELLPDLLGGITINYERFTELYLRELFYLDTDPDTAIKNWKNLSGFLKTLPHDSQRRLRSEVMRRALVAPPLYLLRRLKLHYLWRSLYGLRQSRKEKTIAPAERMRGFAEFAIPIQARFSVDSIASLAKHLREILLEQTGRDILNLPS